MSVILALLLAWAFTIFVTTILASLIAELASIVDELLTRIQALEDEKRD